VLIKISASIREIAEYAGVSVSTVSRVINGMDRVSGETREKVTKALEFLDYKPNEMARVLRGKRSNTIGIVVSDISNNFFAKFIKGAENAAMAEGYNILVCNTDSDYVKERECIALLLSKQVSGIVLASVDFESGPVCSTVPGGRKEDVPFVYIDNLPGHLQEYNSVSIDNALASRQLTQYLISCGHKDIAILAGAVMESTGRDRLCGWKEAMAESGLEAQDNWAIPGAFTLESGICCMEQLLAKKNKPTAVIAANNTIAYGAMLALRQSGYDVPGDISLAAFDVDDETRLISPKITTMNQPVQNFGREAIDICLGLMCDDESNEHKRSQQIILPHDFIEGESVGEWLRSARSGR